jgi:hypothetical protein
MHINSLSGISEHPPMADESAVGAINRPLLLCQGSCDGWGPGGGKSQSRATIGGSLSPCQCTAGSMVQHYSPEPFAALSVNSAKHLCAHRARPVAASSLRPELRLRVTTGGKQQRKHSCVSLRTNHAKNHTPEGSPLPSGGAWTNTGNTWVQAFPARPI